MKTNCFTKYIKYTYLSFFVDISEIRVNVFFFVCLIYKLGTSNDCRKIVYRSRTMIHNNMRYQIEQARIVDSIN